MSKQLVIVESPAKAKTIKKYLGKDFEVLASYGHVRDLLARKGSVDPENNFKMTYVTIEKNAKHLDAIAKALKNAESLLLATDPDREGEAISWHIFVEMQDRGLLDDKPVKRIFFNEITKKAVRYALEHPREISMDLVNAQQARRALDYLVGFNLSPLLWKKVRRGLSAGRVQSPALRLIAEREDEIERFEPQEYWRVTAQCEKEKTQFDARLIKFADEKIEQFTIKNEEQCLKIKDDLLNESKGNLKVAKIEKKQRKRNPAAPFITSTLQQEAARKLGFSARKTMMVAQQLYEGLDIGEGGVVGLITYMRTDSVNLATEAIDEIRKFILEKYGDKNCPKEPRIYKTKSKNAQEAHEAIRPTSVYFTPEKIKASLDNDQFKLYELIWKRTLASQMVEALIDTVAVELHAGQKGTFKATGSRVNFPGFLAVYEEGKDEDTDEKEKMLPQLEEGEEIKMKDLIASQHFTEPPPRYSEASLVKALEDYDIGRPSTYASIIHTLKLREYVTVDKKRFIPTDVGRIVSHFLSEYFTQYVDYKFTATLEDTLDAISRGEREWVPVLKDFWMPFTARIETVDKLVQKKDVTTRELDEACPECGKPLSIRLGKRGRFIGCTGFPECSYTKSLSQEEGSETTNEPEIVEGRTCPDCGGALQIKTGRYGKFIGCSNYPDCKHIEPLQKPEDTGVQCPQCKNANIVTRRSRRGKIFYSCAGYPKCKYALWNQPYDKVCPKCSWPILTLKETKKAGKQLICPQENCDYIETLESDE